MQHIYDLEVLAATRQAELLQEAEQLRRTKRLGKHYSVPRLDGFDATLVSLWRSLKSLGNLRLRRMPKRAV